MASSARPGLTVWFVRHGRTEMNRLGLLQGRGGFGLLPEGFSDAERAARRLAKAGVTALYSSDQQRALETAAVLRKRLGLRRIVRSMELREMDFGAMSGKPSRDVARICPLMKADSTYVFPDGESYAGVQARGLGWLCRLAKRIRRGTVAVVTHGAWLRGMLAALRGIPLNRCLHGTIPHGVVARLVLAPPGLRLWVSREVSIFPETLVDKPARRR